MVGLFFIKDKVQRFGGSKVRRRIRREATARSIAGPGVDTEAAAEPGAAEPGVLAEPGVFNEAEPAIFNDYAADSDGDSFEDSDSGCSDAEFRTDLTLVGVPEMVEHLKGAWDTGAPTRVPEGP